MTEVIDIDGLEDLGGLARTAARLVADSSDRATATLRSVDRWADAGSVATLLDRVASALGDAAVDADVRAAEMGRAELTLLAVLASTAKAGPGKPPRFISWRQHRAWEELHQLIDRRDAYEQIGGYVSETLVAEMDQRLEMLVAGFGRSDWSAIAHLDAGIDPRSWDPGDGLAANDGIVQSIYGFYGEVFLEHPEVEWAGLANLVGAAFYGGWQDLHVLRQVADDSDRAEYLWRLLDLPPLPETVWDVVDVIDMIPLSPTDLVAMIGLDSLEWLEVKMLSMQRDIFRDMGWQLAAYRYGGLPAVEQAAISLRQTEAITGAWADIASGDPDRVAEGNETLLRREQFDIIQDDYDDIATHRVPLGAVMSQVLTLISDHGVPGGNPYREVVTRDISIPVTLPDTPALWPPWELIPVQVETVDVTLPRGSLVDFDDRWEWIETDLLPAYRVLLDDPVALQMLIATPIAERAEERRRLPGLPYGG